jgi:polyphenol oxidase
MIEPLRPDWPAPPGVRAAMTTRAGGVSQGPYASLNLGLGGDDPACVAENRRRLRQALALPAEPRWLKQVHGATVVRLFPSPPRDGPEGPGEGGSAVPEADASYTTDPGVVCVVQAADCLPVLFCDDAGSVVAAAHAGWRGLAAGVLEATVRALPVPPASLMAWLGAAIGPASFEVAPRCATRSSGTTRPPPPASGRPRPRTRVRPSSSPTSTPWRAGAWRRRESRACPAGDSTRWPIRRASIRTAATAAAGAWRHWCG